MVSQRGHDIWGIPQGGRRYKIQQKGYNTHTPGTICDIPFGITQIFLPGRSTEAAQTGEERGKGEDSECNHRLQDPPLHQFPT